MNTQGVPSWSVIWTGVFVANLIVPLFLGWRETHDGGRIGMLGAIAALWAFGLLVSAQSRKMARVLALGGALVALPQLWLHIFAGLWALSLWHGPPIGRGTHLTELGGFAVTVMTGGPLMVLTIVCGLVIDWLFVGRAPDN